MHNSEHIPDRWLLVEVGDIHKVFATCVNGYLHSDSWRLNSGIEHVEVDGDYFLFHGFSGSVYKCHKDAYGTTGYGANVIYGLELEVVKDYKQYMEDALK